LAVFQLVMPHAPAAATVVASRAHPVGAVAARTSKLLAQPAAEEVALAVASAHPDAGRDWLADWERTGSM
jgi:hypothetical protein